MKSANPSAKRVIWMALLNAPTLIMAAIWIFMATIATAIGAKPPSPAEYMAILWPAFAGVALACSSLFVGLRISPIAGGFLAIVGILIMPIAFDAMMP